MRILGLDQSFTKSGIVVVESGNPDMLHYEKFTSTVGNDYFERAWQVALHIQNIVEKFNIDGVFIEGLAFGSRGDQTRNLGGLQYSVINMLRFGECSLRPEVVIVAPTTLKKFATGKGNVKKDVMIETLQEQYPKEFNIFYGEMRVRKSTGLDDMTDAYFLAQYGLANFGKVLPEFVDKQKKVRKTKNDTK